MKSPSLALNATVAALSFFVCALPAQVATLPNVTLKPAEVLNLWPGVAPGETGNIGPEHVLPDRPRPFDQITNVSVPTLSVFHPPPDKRTGTGVLVIPGGGLDRLAIEVEGYEIAEWLNAHGITAFLLKYRVPARSREQRWKVGLQDAQRAMGLIRARADLWKVDRDAIGTIGFSAGAELNVMLSVYHAEARQYPRVDAADDLSTRPDFNIALYGGGFANSAANTLREDIASRINKTTPPMWIAHAFDDSALTSIILMNALKRANIASELHIFAAGAHGFGARDTGLPIAPWRDLCLGWLRWQGFLDTPAIRTFARDFAAAREGAVLPRFTALAPTADLAQAYGAQRRIVRQAVAGGAQVAGYKAAFATAAAQSSSGMKGPAHGVLFKAGKIEASGTTPIALTPKRPLLVETEIGYVIATDIATKLRVPRQALTTIEGIVPVIELPLGPPSPQARPADVRDTVASNVGSNQFIVGAVVSPKTIENPDVIAVSLQRDGTTLHTTKGSDVAGGQAQNLMTLINQIVEQGHVIRRGDIIVSGAMGGAKPGEKGNYTADFGPLGTIAFKIE